MNGTASTRNDIHFMPSFRVLADRIVPEPEGEGFLLPIPAASGASSSTMDAADFSAVADAYRAAGFFKTEINAFAPDWSRARPALAVDLRALVSFARDLPGAPEGPGGQRKLWAALNSGLALGIDVAGFLADRGHAALPGVLSGFLREEKTSPYRLGRFLFWNGADAGAYAGEPLWVRT